MPTVVPPLSPVAVRIGAAAVLVVTVGLLLTAASLEADPAGAGTHTQLGLPACAWHSDRGHACPTCGMTTAFALAAEGRLLAAAQAQPAGALAAILVAMGAWAAGYALVTGRGISSRLMPLRRSAIVVAALALFLAAWGYKLLTG